MESSRIKWLILGILVGVLGMLLFVSPNAGPSGKEVPADLNVKADSSKPDKSRRRDPPTRRAIDAHTHLSGEPYSLARQVMKGLDVRRMVNLSGGRKPAQYKRHIQLSSQFEGRFAVFKNINWKPVNEKGFGQQEADKLEKAVKSGVAGLKVHKALGLGIEDANGDFLPVDAPRLNPIWEKAGELDIPVTIHTADPKAFFKEPSPENERWEELKQAPDWSYHDDKYPERMTLLKQRDRVLKRHRETTFILAHFGNNPENLDYVKKLLEENPNAVLDISARIAEIGRHDPERVRELFIEYDDRILFGTDLMLSVRSRSKSTYYSLMLGSVSKEPPELLDISDFFEKHWKFFESNEDKIKHPIPIQGDWKVHPLNLPSDTLDKLYWKNAERIVFAPHFGRQSAYHIRDEAAKHIEAVQYNE